MVLVPLVYLVVAVATVERAQLAVTNAAREGGRAFATADTAAQGLVRARVAVRLAFAGAGLSQTPDLRFVAAAAGCSSPTVTPALDPGSEFTVCVRLATAVPAIPTLLQGKGITVEGRYLVHVDDYRAAAGAR